jgi:predicted dinucleotide-utilizing enzyme
VKKTKRIGLAGYGFIGSNLANRIEGIDGLEVAFIYNRDKNKLVDVSPKLIADDLNDIARFDPDIVVEAAHPDITRDYGASILAIADYVPVSVTALADDDLYESLKNAASGHGHRLLIPHGALVGLDSLLEWRENWSEVTVTFRKHPDNIDFSDSEYDPTRISGETTLYDGPARGIARLYPRNVNTIITCALATIGLDRLRAVLITDPGLDKAVANVEARGKDGSYLCTTREQPAIGVSGTEMFESLCRSLAHASNGYKAVDFL